MLTVTLHGKKAAGRVALVDDADYELVSQYRWVVRTCKSTNLVRTYVVTYLWRDGKSVSLLMHKLLTGYSLTDHINHDGLDNQRANLRLATTSQNLQNSRPRLATLSRYKGVSYDKSVARKRRKRWIAGIAVNGRTRRLGYFPTEEEAARAYDAAAEAAFGEYACLNFPA